MAPVKPGFRPSASVHQSRPVVPWRHAKQHTGFRCAPALTALNRSVQNKAVSIDGANMARPLAVDRDHDLVEMPRVAELRGSPTDLAAIDPSERLRPAPDGLMADDASARRQQVLDHPQAERKTEIEPDSLLDDVGREPVAAINGFRCRHHCAQRADVRRHFVNLTVPLFVRLAVAFEIVLSLIESVISQPLRHLTKRAVHGRDEYGFGVGFQNGNRIWSLLQDLQGVAADKNVRSMPGLLDQIHSIQPIAFAQHEIDDHEIGFVELRRRHRTRLGRPGRADGMPHFDKHFAKQVSDQIVVFHHEDTACLRVSATAPPFS